MFGSFPLSRRILKYSLLSLSMGALGALFAWPHLEGILDPLPAPAPSSTVQRPQITAQEVSNPQFISHDAQGHTFLIGAEKGTHKGINQVVLSKVRGELDLPNAEKLTLQAKEGQINPIQRDHALLRGGVELHHSGNYHVKTESMEVDMPSATVTTKSPLKASTPYGVLESQSGAKIDQRNKTVDLYGPTKVVFYGKS